MIVERSMNAEWLSNTYLVVDEAGAAAVMIDAGGPVKPLLETVEREGYRLSHVLLTHHHYDHVAELDAVLAAHPQTQVLIHQLERDSIAASAKDLTPGAILTVGGLRIEPLHTPGHTAGMVSLLVGDGSGQATVGSGQAAIFTGDTLFKGSIGGVGGPGHTTYADLKQSVMETLLALAPDTRIYPGHSNPTTVADELAANPFVRIWRGADPEGARPCRALGQPATLILLASDYDGGHKAWVRWPDGTDDIVAGSRVEVSAAASSDSTGSAPSGSTAASE